ncbi:MAG: signal peptide peptidase SppA [Oscillospiraceae bacterium]|nr:signal peptide peptidase SppA [Oscillospiraceae bacterium]
MSKKQIAGLVAAAVVFVFVSAASMMTHNFFESSGLKDLTSMVSSAAHYPSSGSYVGVVDVSGIILNTSSTSIFSSGGYNHQATLDKIDEMTKAVNNRGLLLFVNSPGGGVYESDELYLKLKQYREQTGRPIYVYMANQACSGGYYIAMASDGRVYANRSTLTGSIGVVMQITNVKGLYDKLGIEEINITSGSNKDMGSMGIEMSNEHRALLQSLVDEMYAQFFEIVAEGRDMSAGSLRRVADGRLLTASQAKEAGLIDDIMTYEELQALIREELGSGISIVDPEKEATIFEQLFLGAKELQKKSDAQVIQEVIDKKGNGVLMYHANIS